MADVRRILREYKKVSILHDFVTREIKVDEVYFGDYFDQIEILYKDTYKVDKDPHYRGKIVLSSREKPDIIESFVNVLTNPKAYTIVHSGDYSDDINQKDRYVIADFERRWSGTESEEANDLKPLTDEEKQKIEMEFDEYVKKAIDDIADGLKKNKK